MNSSYSLCFFIFVCAIMFVQMIPLPSADATHTGGRGSDARDKAKAEREVRDAKEKDERNAKNQEIQAAKEAWKQARAAVTTAKQAYVDAKNSGIESDIEDALAELIEKKAIRDAKYADYRDAIKS